VKEIEVKIAQLDEAGQGDQVSRHNYTVDLTNMINEVLSLRHRIEEQLDQEYRERRDRRRVQRRARVRGVAGQSLSNERSKSKPQQPSSGEG